MAVISVLGRRGGLKSFFLKQKIHPEEKPEVVVDPQHRETLFKAL